MINLTPPFGMLVSNQQKAIIAEKEAEIKAASASTKGLGADTSAATGGKVLPKEEISDELRALLKVSYSHCFVFVLHCDGSHQLHFHVASRRNKHCSCFEGRPRLFIIIKPLLHICSCVAQTSFHHSMSSSIGRRVQHPYREWSSLLVGTCFMS